MILPLPLEVAIILTIMFLKHFMQHSYDNWFLNFI